MLWRLRSLLVCMLTCDVCSGTCSWMPNAKSIKKRQQAADVRNRYFQSFPQGFNLAALDAFGPPWTPANCRARIGEKSPQTMHSWQHASSICIWWLQIPNMYIFHLGNGHVCKSFDWLQKTLTSSIVQIKPSGGSLLTLYSTLQHRQMMQRKTFQEYHTNMTKHRLKLCEWNTISIFWPGAEDKFKDPSRTEEI